MPDLEVLSFELIKLDLVCVGSGIGKYVSFILPHKAVGWPPMLPFTYYANFESLIELQIDNGNDQLKAYLNACPANATYLSKISFLKALAIALKGNSLLA